MASVTEAVLTGDFGRLLGAVLAHDYLRELPRRHRLAPADVENAPNGPVVLQHEDVGVDDIVNVYVITDGFPVFVQDRRQALQVMEAEDTARTRVGVVDRLAGAL